MEDEEALSHEADGRLLQDALRGDPIAFVGVLRREEPRLRALAYRVFRDPDLVADALQETALRAFRSLSSYRGEAAFGTWLYRITYTVCLDLLASSERQSQLTERVRDDAPRDETDPADVVAAQDQLARALDALSAEHRAAVYLCIQRGLDLQTAADILGIPYGTVGSRLNHARTVLREALATEKGGVL